MDAKRTIGEPRVFVSRAALLHNITVIRRQLGETTRICAVLKADGYGHCAGLVADTLCNFTCGQMEAPAVDALAVATIDEAIALPDMPVPVMVLRPVENAFIGRQRERLETAVRAGWILTVCSAEAAADVARIAAGCGKRAQVQVMIDTGMQREGASPDAADSIISAITSHASLKLTALHTHFASSEVADDPLTAAQLKTFNAATEVAVWKNPSIVRHAANSGAVFFAPWAHLDMVRPGLAIYGIDPTGRPSVDRPLRPVLRWEAPLAMVRTVRKGEGVSYGQTWKAARDTRVGLVPIGYADGYMRAFSNKGTMMVHNQPVPVIGKVCMDWTCLDLGTVPQAQPGDSVTVLDSDPLSPASAYHLAEWGGTIPYEIFCRIGPRVARVAVEPSDAEAGGWDAADAAARQKTA